MSNSQNIFQKIRNRTPGFWGRIALELLWGLFWCFGKLPRWFRYGVTGRVVYLVLRWVGYRRAVINENLCRSFPDKSADERRAIRIKFYRNLAEVIIDTLSMPAMGPRQCREAMVIPQLEEFRAEVLGRDWIGMMAHYGCWEYCPFWSEIEPSQVVLGVYHPLRNKLIDHFFRRLRTRERIIPVPMNKCLRFYLKHREEGIGGCRIALGLISDQNPPRRPDCHWFRFLNQDTIFFDGAEKLALRCGVPVYFSWMHRVRSGVYEMYVERIYDGSEPVAPHEITERYVRALEREIIACPEMWLWSHRRWKHKSPADLARLQRCEGQK